MNDIEELFKGKTIKGEYLVLYSKDNVYGQSMRAELHNCDPDTRLQMCADAVMELVSHACDPDDVLQLRLAMKRVIIEFLNKPTVH